MSVRKARTASEIGGQSLPSLINIWRWPWWNPLPPISLTSVVVPNFDKTSAAITLRWRYRAFFAHESIFFLITVQSCLWSNPRWAWSHLRSRPQQGGMNQVFDQCSTLVKWPMYSQHDVQHIEMDEWKNIVGRSTWNCTVKDVSIGGTAFLQEYLTSPIRWDGHFLQKD